MIRKTPSFSVRFSRFALFKLAILVVGLAYSHVTLASGAFNPPGVRAPSPDYAKGKAIFNGGTKIGDSPACKSCHTGKYRLKRGPLKGLGANLSTHVTTCSSHKPCYEGKLSEDQLKAITVYLQTRYRL